MNYEEIKKLIEDMGSSKIEELEIEFPEGMKIKMKKDKEKVIAKPEPEVCIPVSNISHIQVKPEENVKIVKSPMVGTFYASNSPKEPPFVKVGDKVKNGQVLCIIEAMKLMNEVESEYDGEIVEICVKNEDMVEFDTPLFKIK